MAYRGHSLITDFVGGELSPRWMSRVEGGGLDPLQGGGSIAEVYRSGAREITNMIVMPQGGVTKRHGTLFGRDLTVDFPGVVASDFQAFRFEFPGTDFLTVWAPGLVKVYNTATFNISVAIPSPVASFTTPFTASDVRALQVAQLQDSMITFTPNWRMRVLRVRAGVWTFTDAEMLN